jgi:hypothetical protein
LDWIIVIGDKEPPEIALYKCLKAGLWIGWLWGGCVLVM